VEDKWALFSKLWLVHNLVVSCEAQLDLLRTSKLLHTSANWSLQVDVLPVFIQDASASQDMAASSLQPSYATARATGQLSQQDLLIAFAASPDSLTEKAPPKEGGESTPF
jgi:hypothetical protein